MTRTFDPFDADAWPDAPGCDAFEQAIMLRSRAALAPQAVPVLEAHLGACESCRDHAARTAKVDAMLAPYGGHDLATTSWQSVHDRLRDDVRRYQRRTPWTLGIALVAALALTAVARALFDPAHLTPGPFIATAVVFYFGMRWVYRRGSRRMEQLLHTDDVVGAYRGELERKLRWARNGMWMWPVSLALKFAASSERLQPALAGDGRARAHLAVDVFMVVLAVSAFVRSVVNARRLRRELEALK